MNIRHNDHLVDLCGCYQDLIALCNDRNELEQVMNLLLSSLKDDDSEDDVGLRAIIASALLQHNKQIINEHFDWFDANMRYAIVTNADSYSVADVINGQEVDIITGVFNDDHTDQERERICCGILRII